MTIEIQKPELEALILQRLQGGAFQSVEDVLLHALESVEPARGPQPGNPRESSGRTGADLVAAMQASPYKETSLESQGLTTKACARS